MNRKWTSEEEFKIELLAGKYSANYLANELKRSPKSIATKLYRLSVKQKENLEGLKLYTQTDILVFFKITRYFLKALIESGYIEPKKKNINNFYKLFTESEKEKIEEFMKNNLTLEEFGDKVNLSASTLRAKIKAKELTCIKINGQIRIPVEELKKFLLNDEEKDKLVAAHSIERIFAMSKSSFYRNKFKKVKKNKRVFYLKE